MSTDAPTTGPENPHAEAESPRGWAATARGRAELAAVALFILANLLVPCCFRELYPFSRALMFCDAPVRYCEYTVTGPRGEPLPPVEFGLQRNYWGNPVGVGTGFRPPPSVDTFGEVPDQAAVTAMVEERLRRRGGPDFVDVVQTVVGDADGNRVGPVEERRWRVPRPAEEATP